MMWKSKQNDIYLCVVESDFTASLYDVLDTSNRSNKIQDNFKNTVPASTLEKYNKKDLDGDYNSLDDKNSLDSVYSLDSNSRNTKPIYSGDLTQVLDYCWQNGHIVNLQFSSSAIYLVTKIVPSTIKQHDKASWEQYQALELFPEEEYVKVISSGANSQNIKQSIKQSFTTWISFGPIKHIISKYRKCINSLSSRSLDLYSQLSKVLHNHSDDQKYKNTISKDIQIQYTKQEDTRISINNAIVVFALEHEFVCIGAVYGHPVTVRTFSKKSLDIREDIEETIAYAKQFDNYQILKDINNNYDPSIEIGNNQSVQKTTRSLGYSEDNSTVDKIVLVNFSQIEKKLWEQFSFSLPVHFSDIGLDIIESIPINYSDSAQAMNTNQRFAQLLMGAVNVFCIMIIGYYWIKDGSLYSEKERLKVLQAQNTKVREEIKNELHESIDADHIQQMSNYKDVFSKSFRHLSMLGSFASQGESITKEIIYSNDLSGVSSFKLVLHVIKPQSYELLIQTHSRLRSVLEMIFKDMQIKLESDGQVHDSYMSYVAFISSNVSSY